MKKILLLVLFFGLNEFVHTQPTLYISRNFKNAYEKNSRSYDGSHGGKYWQNKSEYKIRAELLPKERLLSGEEVIIYYNNSPDTLKQVILKLLPDIYQALDKAAKVGIIKKNNASRRKSRLTKLIDKKN